jgi:hypothetical protein
LPIVEPVLPFLLFLLEFLQQTDQNLQLLFLLFLFSLLLSLSLLKQQQKFVEFQELAIFTQTNDFRFTLYPIENNGRQKEWYLARSSSLQDLM